jgi:outer membrane protein
VNKMITNAMKCALGILAVAASVDALAAGKYGIVDMQKIIMTVNDGKAARDELQKEINAKEKELENKKKELDKMNEEWKTQSALMSEDARMSKQKEFQEKFLGLRNEEMEFQGEIKRKEQKATQKIATKVASLVDGIAKEKKLEVVFEANSAGLLYVDGPVDLTDQVITAYNKAKPETAKK